jgi:hypothetical protein
VSLRGFTVLGKDVLLGRKWKFWANVARASRYDPERFGIPARTAFILTGTKIP